MSDRRSRIVERGLRRTRRQWESLGREDPLWGVLSLPEKKGNRWEVDDFLETGRSEINSVMEDLGRLGIEPAGPALDVGCGAGRLTQALAAELGRAVGVDVSSTMIAKARELNRTPQTCAFQQTDGDGLAVFEDGSLGFVYSVLALQHSPRNVIEAYLHEFCRVVVNGGTLVFQVPTGKASGPGAWRIRANLRLRRAWRRMDIHYLPQERIESILKHGSCRVVAGYPDWRAGGGWRSRTFVAIKDQA